MAEEFSNWSGHLRFRPSSCETPNTEDEVAAIVRRAAEEGRRVRVVGKGHSSSPLVETADVLVSLERMAGVVACDTRSGTASVLGGTTLRAMGDALLPVGMSLENLGDVNYQAFAGAVGTGTHGSGQRLQNLAAHFIGGRIVVGDGSVLEFDLERDHQMLRAMRVSLGVLGIMTRLDVKLIPAVRLERREYCAHIDDCLADLDRLFEGSRNFDFYWYPRRDEAKLRLLDEPGRGLRDLAYARLLKQQEGWAPNIIPKERGLKFEEMEYAMPAEAGPQCFGEIRRRVRERHRRCVAWRVLYRTVAPDDACLSTAFGRQTVTISILQNVGLPHEEYFADMEPVFRDHGGRPHWGKIHSLRAADLEPLYPAWGLFQETRRRLDPEGRFTSEYLRLLLGEN